MPLSRRLLLPALATPFLIRASGAGATGTASIVVGGTGGALGPLRTLGVWFTEQTGIPVTVLPSVGSEGGIRATADGRLHIGVAGRALREPDFDRGLSVAQIWRTPIGFVTSVADPRGLVAAELAGFIANTASTWADGTPLRPILRPPMESDYPIMFAQLPGLADAFARLRQRPELPIAATDQEALDLAERMPGSLVNATLAQVITEGRDLRFVPLSGKAPAIEALESGEYTLAKSMHVIQSRRTPPHAEQFIAYLRTADAQSRLRRCGCLV